MKDIIRMTKYSIHDNGGTPFWVVITGKSVTVLKNMNTYEFVNGKHTEVQHPSKELFTIKVDEVFVGKTSPTGPKSPPGTAILCRVGSKYVYIGKEIYEFSTNDVISKFQDTYACLGTCVFRLACLGQPLLLPRAVGRRDVCSSARQVPPKQVPPTHAT